MARDLKRGYSRNAARGSTDQGGIKVLQYKDNSETVHSYHCRRRRNRVGRDCDGTGCDAVLINTESRGQRTYKVAGAMKHAVITGRQLIKQAEFSSCMQRTVR
jgi:hypothetical protein